MKTKRLHIFKAGSHISQDGSAVTMTFRDLLAVANHYDPNTSEAPIVIGHPTTDAPAHGWVSRLFVTNDGLEAEVDQVDEAFEAMVKAGRYKKISASFYAPQSRANPVPGSYYLRHVGFLGAELPAIKGLRQVSFAENDDAITFDINQETREMKGEDSLLNQIKKLLMQFMGTLPAEDDEEAAGNVEINGNQAMLAEKGAQAKRAANEENKDDTQPDETEQTAKSTNDKESALTETVAEESVDEQKAGGVSNQESDDIKTEDALDIDAIEKAGEVDGNTLAKMVARIKALEKLLAEKAEQAEKNKAVVKKQEAANFAESLVTSGRILPYQKDRVVEVMLSLEERSVVNFSEGDSESLKQAYCSLLSSLPRSGPVCGVFSIKQTTPFSEGVMTSSVSHEFSEAQDLSRLNLHQEIEALARKENISYEQAAKALSKMRESA